MSNYDYQVLVKALKLMEERFKEQDKRLTEAIDASYARMPESRECLACIKQFKPQRHADRFCSAYCWSTRYM